MRTSEIRQRWLDYFEARGHHVVPSASLVSSDPSLLFTVAGMVPFIPYMLGQVKAPWPRATSVQKCVRTQDIEEVGKTTRHGTFFQMNGNFSFGDYFKKEAIGFAWELITGAQSDGSLGFDPDKIWVTVYHDDDEAAALWRKIAGLPEERIQRRGMADNFWSTGQPGPAGPCSEIYVDRGAAYGAEGGPVVDEERYLEIWNLVFMQYERGAGTSKDDFEILGELEQKNIDTGLGLERAAFLLQDVDNMYEIDEVFPVITTAQELSGKKYGADHGDDVRMRVVADHIRSGLMLISDGVTPSNEGRGYVLRRLLRRAIRAMRLLGVDDPTMAELMTTSKDAMKTSYPELEEDWSRIKTTACDEEGAFLRTLASGTTILDTAVAKVKRTGGSQLSGAEAFTLHDTYGFPIDLTLEMAAEQGLSVDQEKFRALMSEQRSRARADALTKKTGHADTSIYSEVQANLRKDIDFLGYVETSAEARVVALLQDGVSVPAVTGPADVELILDRTPFYAEAGGQLADHGTIGSQENDSTFLVSDVQKPIAGMIVHRGHLASGTIALGETLFAEIDSVRRKDISRAHTATHMVHKALRESLGSTATQAGSENAPSRMRFDFRYGSAVPPDAMSQIEERVNSRLADDLEVTEQIMALDDARELGAMALFGEKYGSRVRVVSIGGDWSRELCAGTHLSHTGQLGRVSLLGEASIGSGVRRVEALVGDLAYAEQAREHALVSQLATLLKTPAPELPERIAGIVGRLKDLEKEAASLRQERLMGQASKLAGSAKDIDGILTVAADLGELQGADALRGVVADVRQRLGEDKPSVVAFAGHSGGRPVVIVATNQAARDRGIKAGAMVKIASAALGGGGGGRDDMAQGGGSDAAQIPQALRAIESEIAA